jgi:DNA modification methylase
MNHLYYGDNLDVLRRYVAEESADLIYLDPPFNSNQDYNILFAEKDGTRSAAQIKAFEDTWQWDQVAAEAYQETVELGGKVSQVMQAFRTFLGDSNLLAYLAMMAPRLVKLRQVLKPTGSIYLHCDPTASHYLKMLMDAVFSPRNFRNEIVWKRTTAHSASRRWNDVHDCLLFYSRSDAYLWNTIFLPHSEEYGGRFKRKDLGGQRWADDNLTGPGVRHGESGGLWRGVNPTEKGLHWKVSNSAVNALIGNERIKHLGTLEKLDLLDRNGLIYWPKPRPGTEVSFPRFKRYLSGGLSIQDVITDIPPINSQAQERLHYPTQKPEALLERIIQASSNEGDTVLDPFCGCGTAIAVAQNLNRSWVGIDITYLAINLIKNRLNSAFGDGIEKSYQVTGEPVSLPDAKNLARQDHFQFQCWALGLVEARSEAPKRGADKGIDGRLYFHDDSKGRETKQVIFSVKAGHTSVPHVRDLRGVVEREKAQIGVLIAMEEPTKPMKTEAAGAGFYDSPWGSRHPRLQILTIEELLEGKGVDRPPHKGNVTFKKAPRVYKKQEEQPELL